MFERPTLITPVMPYEPLSPEGLAVRWVGWILSAPREECPVLDEDGSLGALRQPDDVWFLAGTFGGHAHRSLVVPTGVPLYVPAVNLFDHRRYNRATLPEEAYGSVTLDGDEVPTHHATVLKRSKILMMENNAFTSLGGVLPVSTAAIAAVLTVTPGYHRLELRGGLGAGFSVSVTYDLEVRRPNPL